MTITCDTSVLVPVLASWHAAHEQARAAVADVNAVPAHVLVETYSVLTRLPGAQRLSAETAAAAIEALPWKVLTLSGDGYTSLIPELAERGISGGASHDAVVAATAREHDLTLVSRDPRAQRTYDALGVRYTMA